ncbi:MFS transporter [Nonomuraea guangzhouensis]|uniref:MFS transporter n=1 Tax=Nonomuraea guangzhouensis TaxID=1291555 RepID=A0ABW4G9A2_9ACTN|nr:MFS transporter [Nonomuraea guangzhouensis]
MRACDTLMRAELPLRLARTAAFAAVCVGLAALAHAMGGGSVPAPHTAALGLGAVLLAALALGGRERSAPTINVALVCAQLGLHEWFGTDGTAYVISHPHGRGLSEGVGMLLAHLTATLITGWWLARGETALWALLHRLGHRLALLRPVAVAAVRRAVPIVIVRIVPVDPVLLHCVARRGPPLPA